MKAVSKKIRVLSAVAFLGLGACTLGAASMKLVKADDAVVAKAEGETVAYTLDATVKGKDNSYAGSEDIAINGVTWNMTGNSTTQPWRLGGKSLTNVNRAIYSKTAISNNISKVVVTFGTNSGVTVNSFTFGVYSTPEDAAANTNAISTLTPTYKGSSDVTIERPEGVAWDGVYYSFVLNVTVSGTKNKYLEFNKAVFYGGESTSPSLTVTNAPTGNLSKGDTGAFAVTTKNATNPVVTWASSAENVLAVESATGAYEAKAGGSATITASLACDETSTPITAKFDVVVEWGMISISEAKTLCTNVSGATATDKDTLFSFQGYIVNLNADSQSAGSERMITISDKKVGEEGGVTLNVYGVYSTNVIRKYAILNGFVTVTGNPAKYKSVEQIANPELSDYMDTAMTFAVDANDLLDAECAARDVKEETWNTIKAKYEALDTYAQAKLAAAGTDYAYDDEIKNFVARYVIIVNGYGYEDFMSSSAIKAKNAFFANSAKDSGIAAWTIGAGLFALLAAGCFVFLKKKKLTK